MGFLETERSKTERIVAYGAACTPSFVSPLVARILETSSESSGEVLGGGILLRPVGVCACTSNSTKNFVRGVMHALLTLHRLGVTHGDARLENLVLYEDKLVWIDFRECQIEGDDTLARRWDLRTCLNSLVVHFSHDSTRVTNLEEELLARYDAALPSGSSDLVLIPLVDAVWTIMTTRNP